jgi:hypothetical protein
MVFNKVSNDSYLLRFDTDELLVRGIQQFCEEQNINGAWIQGLGGAAWAELAFYHLDQKAYEFDRINEPLEISNLTGNVALLNQKPFLHLHVTVSDLNYHSYAGHLKELAVGGTAEVLIRTFDSPITRVHNDANGLKVFDFSTDAE